jgi:hypothetical protein
MPLTRLILKWITGIIQILLAAVLFYFPAAELFARLGQRARISESRPHLLVEDSLLPCLALALIYTLVSAIRRKIEPAEVSEENARGLNVD